SGPKRFAGKARRNLGVQAAAQVRRTASARSRRPVLRARLRTARDRPHDRGLCARTSAPNPSEFCRALFPSRRRLCRGAVERTARIGVGRARGSGQRARAGRARRKWFRADELQGFAMSPALQVPVHAAGWLPLTAPLARPAATRFAEWVALAVPLARPAIATICLSAIAYYLYAIRCARAFFRLPPQSTSKSPPPISILKPIRGLDVDAYENFASFCRQDYPQYELIFGAEAEDEPGLQAARSIARDFPETDVKIVVNGRSIGTNPKVSNLANMAAEARYANLLVSDSDIRVDPTHLSTLAKPLADADVGVVTCLYRSKAGKAAGWVDALGLSTEFQPSVLVARQLEGMSFAMGSGILIRRSVLASIGGFAAFADYLADDFQLGNRPRR